MPFEALSTQSLPLIATALGMLALGIGVLVREKASRESRSFLVLSLTVAVWQLGFAGMYSTSDPAAALIWAKGSYLGIPLIAPALLGFAASILRVHRPPRRVVVGAWLVGGAFAFTFAATDLLLATVELYSWGYYPRFGWRAAPYLAFFCGTLAFAMWCFLRELRETAPGVNRDRIRWLVIAFGIAYVAVVDYVPTFGIALYPFGYVTVLIFQGFVAWIIGRFRLVDLTPSFAADQILETMADALIVVDERAVVQILNRAACQVLGVEREALIGQPIEALATRAPGSGPRLRDLCAGVVARDQEMELSRDGNPPLDVSISASPLTDARGNLAGTVLIARDIRERMRAERALRESEERFRSLIENISDAIVVVDAEGVIQFASPSLERVIGWSPAERLGRSILELVHPEEQPAIRQALRTEADLAGKTLTSELRLAHRDGSWRLVEVQATNLLRHPAVGGIVVAYHDITEKREAEEALRQSEERLLHAQRLEAVGRLAGGVAHDFNNLLTVINGQTGMLLDGSVPASDEREALEEVHRAGERGAWLAGQLLAFSRKQVLKPRPLELNSVVLDMSRMLRRLLGDDVQLETSLGDDIGPVMGDQGQIEQVLMNLAVNARDALPHGGHITIRTESLSVDGRRPPDVEGSAFVCISVIDDGAGMSPEVSERVFEPFFTTKEVGKGTGLGLSTVYGIVKQSGGWIEIDSAPGEGSKFRVFLPRTAEPVQSQVTSPASDGRSHGHEVVLVVEDDEGVRRLVRRILEAAGFRVLEAADGTRALAQLASAGDQIDLLLGDVVMPGMNGRTLGSLAVARYPRLRVLLMSAYWGLEPDPEAPGREFSVLAKPFDREELIEGVRKALRSSPGPEQPSQRRAASPPA